MRSWIFAAVAAVAGLGIGLALRGNSLPPVRTIVLPPKLNPVASVLPPLKTHELPELPKPPLETPIPIAEEPSGPTPMVGNLSTLPPAGGIGGSTLMEPGVPSGIAAPDLNADEALVRRTVALAGAEVVSVSDARDASGKIGRAIVAETGAGGRDALRNALRKALGDHVVISDAGSVPTATPELKRMEDELAVARKKRDQARIDFLPQAPALRDIEEQTLALEKEAAARRQASARLRLNVLIRPVL